MTAPPVGTRLARDLLLDADAVRDGARLVGDLNPLHHDAAYAAASRFGGLIASGAHTAAVLAGVISELIAERGFGPAVGMDYQVRFLRPVHVGRRMRMEWRVAHVEPTRLGEIGRLEGRMVDAEDGSIAITAAMHCLFFAEAERPEAGGAAVP